MRKLVIAAITAGAGIAFTPVADSNTVSCGNTVPCGGNVGSLSGATVRLYTQSGAGVLLHDPGSPSIVPFEITPGVQGKSNLVLSGAGSGGVGMTINAGNTMQFQIGGTTELTVGTNGLVASGGMSIAGPLTVGGTVVTGSGGGLMQNVAAIASLMPANGTLVSVAGYYAPGDGGAGVWKYSTSGCSVAWCVSASTGSWTFVPTTPTVDVRQLGAKPDGTTNNTQAFQNAIGVLQATFGGGTMHLSAAFTPGNPGTPQCYLKTATVNLPSFTASGNPWDEGNPFHVQGDGPVGTCWHYTGTGFALAHPTIGSTTKRGQNAGVEVSGISFVGPQSSSNNACALGIDNTTMPNIHDNWFSGWTGIGGSGNQVGGCAIELSSYQTGGTYGARIYRNRFGLVKAQSLTGADGNGYTVYSLADMTQNEVRYALWLNGPYDTNGKVNDVRFEGNRCEDFLVGCVRIQGNQDIWSGSNLFSTTNFSSSGNQFLDYDTLQMETGQIAGANGVTGFTLRTVSGSYLYSGPQLVGLGVCIQNNVGNWPCAYIASATGRAVTLAGNGLSSAPIYATGTAQGGTSSSITLQSGSSGVNNTYTNTVLTATAGTCAGKSATITGYTGATLVANVSLGCIPDGTTQYAIASNYVLTYADSTSQGEWPNPAAIGHAFYWSSQGKLHSVSDYFERATPLVASGSQSNCMSGNQAIGCPAGTSTQTVAFIDAEFEVLQNLTMSYEDGSQFVPMTQLGISAVGDAQAPTVIPSGIVGDVRFPSNEAPLSHFCLNATGHTLNNGDIVALDQNGGGSGLENCIDPPSTWTAGTEWQYTCKIVATSQTSVTQSWAPGTLVPVATGGQEVRVAIDPKSAAVNTGYILLPEAPSGGHNGMAFGISPVSAPAQAVANSCGYAIGTAQGGTTVGTLIRARSN